MKPQTYAVAEIPPKKESLRSRLLAFLVRIFTTGAELPDTDKAW